MHLFSLGLGLFIIFSAAGLPSLHAQEWTRFRGPNGTGIVTDAAIPVTWTEKNFAWRVAISGESHSQPVIWGDKIFINTAMQTGQERALVCLQKSDGKILWTKQSSQPTHRPGNKNSGYANSSPVVDRERVITCSVSSDHFWVRAYAHNGTELWSRDLGGFKSQHGHGASPIIYDQAVIVTNDQAAESFVVALDLKTGNPVWKCARNASPGGTAYGTPIILSRPGEPTQMILTGKGHGLSSLNPKTGTLNWEAPVFDKRMVASPVVADDLAIGSCGQGGGAGNFLSAVRLGGTGNVAKTHLAYTLNKATPYVPTPLFLDGILYLISDGGIASAIEAKTGREIWSERLRAEFFGSPVLVNGKIYCPSTKGEMIVLATGDTFNLLARNPLGEGSHSTPCVDQGRFYVKTFTHLVCVSGP
ncbi:MAG: hypothetical protein RL077_3620 [Verrucomicrobiota bacterium]|jgi:outer membrane protein assembly factor BamB